MTLTLTLTPEREARLLEQARAAGLTLDDYVQHVIDQIAVPAQTLRTGADLLAQWEREGAFLPDDGLDSPEQARRIRTEAWERG